MLQLFFSFQNLIFPLKWMSASHSSPRSNNIPFKCDNPVIKPFFQKLCPNFQILYNNRISINKLNNFFYIFIYKFFIGFYNISCKVNNSIFPLCIWNNILNFLLRHPILKITFLQNLLNNRQIFINLWNPNIFNW